MALLFCTLRLVEYLMLDYVDLIVEHILSFYITITIGCYISVLNCLFEQVIKK